jgi:hypothetical protein
LLRFDAIQPEVTNLKLALQPDRGGDRVFAYVVEGHKRELAKTLNEGYGSDFSTSASCSDERLSFQDVGPEEPTCFTLPFQPMCGVDAQSGSSAYPWHGQDTDSARYWSEISVWLHPRGDWNDTDISAIVIVPPRSSSAPDDHDFRLERSNTSLFDALVDLVTVESKALGFQKACHKEVLLNGLLKLIEQQWRHLRISLPGPQWLSLSRMIRRTLNGPSALDQHVRDSVLQRLRECVPVPKPVCSDVRSNNKKALRLQVMLLLALLLPPSTVLSAMPTTTLTLPQIPLRYLATAVPLLLFLLVAMLAWPFLKTGTREGTRRHRDGTSSGAKR